MNESLTISVAEAAKQLGVCTKTVYDLTHRPDSRLSKNDTDVIPVILTKEQLRAAQTVGESSKELIHRICSRDGYKVLDIGKADRRTFEIDLSEMWWY